MRRPLGSKKLETDDRKDAGSGRRSRRFPPKIRLNFPREGLRLQASPT